MPRAHQRSTHRTVAALCHALNGSASSAELEKDGTRE